jgi:hypothetical protein
MAHQNKILITMTKEDEFFTHGKVMYIAGKEDAHEGDLGTIMLPVHAKDVNIAAATPDPVVFSYSNTEEDVVRLRVVIVEIQSKGGTIPSSCTLSVVVPSTEGNWVPRTKNVKLVLADGTTLVLRNPHGMAQNGGYLYFIDYESQLLIIVKKDDLEAAADNSNVKVKTVDLTDEDYGELPPEARGQAIITMNNKLYALYLDTTDITATNHNPGHLLRFSIDSAGDLTYEVQTLVGLNPQGIIPVATKASGVEVIKLLIPAIGGEQYYTGATNGTNSNISVVDAEAASWPPDPTTGGAPILVTGDAYTIPTPPTPLPEASAYDIMAIGAAMRDGSSLVFILTKIYVDNAKGAYWMLYLTTVDELLKLLTKQQQGAPLTLTEAVNATDVDFKILDEGIVIAPEYVPDPEEPDVKVPYAIYFWGIVYEQAIREDDKEDRIWLALGSPFLVTKAEAYSSPTTTQENPYVVISGFGGVNTNSIDVTIETPHQAIREVSLHRGVRAARISLSRPAAEEEEGK